LHDDDIAADALLQGALKSRDLTSANAAPDQTELFEQICSEFKQPSAAKKSKIAEQQTDQVLFVQIRQWRWRLQSPAVSACGQPFCRRSYGVATAACRQQQQQQTNKEAVDIVASSDDVSGVGITVLQADR